MGILRDISNLRGHKVSWLKDIGTYEGGLNLEAESTTAITQGNSAMKCNCGSFLFTEYNQLDLFICLGCQKIYKKGS